MLLRHPEYHFGKSVAATFATSLVFGGVKFTRVSPLRTALQTTIVGGMAAAIAFAVARIVS